MTTERSESLLEFPCHFPIKAMGRQSTEFERAVSEIILGHARLIEGESLRMTPSRAGNYVSITAVIEAESQIQLDTIYQSLTDCELVLVAL
jgi:putative lipoic acid-binding regulatory protein